MSETQLREKCFDAETGEMLWDRPYIFKGLNRPDSWFIENYVTYTVFSSTLYDDGIFTLVRALA